MKLDSLTRPALKAARRAASLARWNISDDLKSTLKYVFFRNRIAVSLRVWTHLVFLFEIFLIFKLFHSRLAASVGILLVVSLLMRAFHRGIVQMARVRMIELSLRRDSADRISLLYSWLLKTSALLGAIGGAALLALSFAPAMAPVTKVFAAVNVVILPLQLAASAAMSTHFIWQRLRRNSWFTFTPYLIPSLTLLATYRIIGPYGYVLGFFLSRLGFYGYTLWVSHESLRRRGVRWLPNGRGIISLAKLEFLQNELAAHIWIPLAAELYIAGLSICIYLRGPEMWLTHFAFNGLLIALSYPLLRIPISLSTDLYFALRSGHTMLAQLYERRIRLLFRCAVAVVPIAAVAVFAFISFKWGMVSGIAYTLAPYLVPALIVRTIFNGRLVVLAAVGAERRAAMLIGAGFILMLLYQAFTITVQRANLPAVYSFEIIAMLGLYLALRKIDPLRHGALTQAVTNRLPSDTRLRPLQELSQAKASEGAIVLLHEYFHPVGRQQKFVTLMLQELGAGVSAYKICARCFYVTRSSTKGRKLSAELFKRFPGHIREVLPIDDPLDIVRHGSMLRTHLKRKGTVPEALQVLIRGIESGIFARLANAFLENPVARRGAIFRHQFVLEQLSAAGAGSLPHYEITPEGRKLGGNCSDELIDHVRKRSATSSELLPRHESPFAQISVLGETLFIFDLTPVKIEKRADIYTAATCLSLIFSLAALNVQWEGRYPEASQIETAEPAKEAPAA